jgi:hypothetical protein
MLVYKKCPQLPNYFGLSDLSQSNGSYFTNESDAMMANGWRWIFARHSSGTNLLPPPWQPGHALARSQAWIVEQTRHPGEGPCR